MGIVVYLVPPLPFPDPATSLRIPLTQTQTGPDGGA